MTFANEIVDAGRFGHQQKIGDGIGYDAVDFFRHRSVEATQTSLDVGDSNSKFGGGKRCGHG